MFWNSINMELFAAATAWCCAQLLKGIINLLMNRTCSLDILLGSGGMPSSHSATVCALTVAIGYDCGTASPIFGVCCIFAFVVMYDAMGVRRETGNQGRVINDMIRLFEDMGQPIPVDRKFKELVGHTPLQVVCGALLGLAVGFVLMPMKYF